MTESNPAVFELMAVLARLWASILNSELPKRGDNFFEQGGSSLLALQLIVSVREELRIDARLATLFENPTFGEFSDVLFCSFEGEEGVI